MKNVIKLSVLLLSIPLVLTSCEDLQKKAYCVETSDSLEYNVDKCYQISYKDIRQTFYLINPPLNPEDGSENLKYDFVWKDYIKLAYFTLTGGLEGKTIVSVLKLGDQILKVNVDGRCTDSKATSGYVKINPYAFKPLTERVSDAYLYAYIAIGETSGLVDKVTNTNETDSK